MTILISILEELNTVGQQKQFINMRLPSEPVRNTCPDIDRLQKIINGLKDDFGSFKEHDSTDDFLTSMNNACWELRDIYDTLEDLRNSNSALRDWGHELTSLAEEMENEKDAEISEKEVEIENLEERVQNLQDELDNVQ